MERAAPEHGCGSAERNRTGRQGGETPWLGRRRPVPGPNIGNPSFGRYRHRAKNRRGPADSGPEATATAGASRKSSGNRWAINSGNKRRNIPVPQRSPLLATLRKDLAAAAIRNAQVAHAYDRSQPANPLFVCAMCGEPVLKRRRRHFHACMPKARRKHGLHAIEAASKALAAQTAAGNDPRRNAAVNRARAEAISEGHRRNRSWAREHPNQRDEAWFKREIAPKLDTVYVR